MRILKEGMSYGEYWYNRFAAGAYHTGADTREEALFGRRLLRKRRKYHPFAQKAYRAEDRGEGSDGRGNAL